MPFTFNYHRIIQLNDYIYQREKKEQSSWRWPIERTVRSFYPFKRVSCKKPEDMKLDLMFMLIDEMCFFFSRSTCVCVCHQKHFSFKSKKQNCYFRGFRKCYAIKIEFVINFHLELLIRKANINCHMLPKWELLIYSTNRCFSMDLTPTTTMCT